MLRNFGSAAGFLTAMQNVFEIVDEAGSLVEAHGCKARQVVVDEIVLAIKFHDIETAKRWDLVGQEVDRLLLSEADGDVPAAPLTFSFEGGQSHTPPVRVLTVEASLRL